MVKEKDGLKVVWTQTAERLLFEILDYWNNRNKSTNYSSKLLETLWSKTTFLSKNPRAAKTSNIKSVRISAMGHFSIVYTFDTKNLTILAFWDNRQDPKKLIQLLKANKP